MADAHKAAGNESFKEGRYAEAAQHFTAAIDLDPGNAVLRSNRSGAFASLGRYADALADAEEAVALQPDWSKGYSRMAAALYGLGRYAESADTFQRGLQVDPSNAQMTQALQDVSAKLAAAQALHEAAAAGDAQAVGATLQSRVHPEGCVSL